MVKLTNKELSDKLIIRYPLPLSCKEVVLRKLLIKALKRRRKQVPLTDKNWYFVFVLKSGESLEYEYCRSIEDLRKLAPSTLLLTSKVTDITSITFRDVFSISVLELADVDCVDKVLEVFNSNTDWGK